MRLSFSFFCCVFFCILPVKAYNLRQISHADGLSNSAVLSVFQDNDGLMWFGTCDGLNMFDGSDVRVYKSTDDNNLSGNLIEDIIETEDDVLWLQTNYGLNRLETTGKVVNYYSYFTGRTFLRKDNNNTLFILKDNNVVYYYDSQTNQINKIAIRHFEFSDLLNCVIDRNNVFYLFFKDGEVVSYRIEKNEKIEFRLLSVEKNENNILYCFNTDETVYYVDDNYTLFEFDYKNKKDNYILNLKTILQQRGEISSIVKYKDDYFIGFKINGLIRLKNTPEKRERYEVEEIDIKSGVFCIYRDKNQDVVWVGTDGQGVFLLYDSQYTIRSYTFNNIPFKVDKPVRSLLLDKDNTLWVGTKGDGIIKIFNFNYGNDLSGSKIEKISTENSALSDNSVYAFAESAENLLWIGHEEGLDVYSYHHKKIKRVPLEYEGVPLKYIHSIRERNDTLWIASVGMGIIRAVISGTVDEPVLIDVTQLTANDGKPGFNHFFTNYIENGNTVWYGNRGHGLFKVNAQTLETSSVLFGNEASNQLLNDVFSILKEDDNLWCGTSYGLVKYTPKKEVKVFNEQVGFPSNTVHGILKDSGNNLWLSTNQGIIRFETANETFQTYANHNGLNITEFSDGAYFKDSKTGSLLFGGIEGFVSVAETDYIPHDYQPDIVFNNLTLFGEDYNIYDFYTQKGKQEMLELKHDQNFFGISFSASDYVNGNNYSYFYQLSGLNEQWIENKGNKTISFTNIAPGKYTLSVKYLNRVTGQESPVYPIILNIRPPWYSSMLASVVYVILVFAVVGVVIWLLIRKNRKKRQQMLEKIQQQHREEVHESKLRFFTNIAHEFCTPLTLIYAPCNRILSHKGSDKFVVDYTKIIQRNAERLNGLIQELIEFRRIETGNRIPRIEELSITELAGEIINSFSEIFESHKFNFEHHIQKSLRWNSDKSFMYTIITNLLSNALKYTNKNGTIRMQIKSSDDQLFILVSNTGKGIKKEDYSRIFDRYSILSNLENKDENNAVSQNGLGLAISYNLVKLLKGKIEIESEIDEETIFTVTLPQQDVVDLPQDINMVLPEITIKKDYTTQLELPEYSFDSNKQTIFVIDDDIEILWLICEIFKDEFNVLPFNKIKKIDDVLGDIYPDLIICDVMMPNIDGITLVKYFKENKKLAHIPLILVSAKNDVEDQIKGLTAGAEMYIAKPFNVDYLKVSVNRLISRKKVLKDYFTSSLSAFDLIDGKLTHKGDRQFLQKILDIINNNLLDVDLSANFIAKELNFSTRHLHRKLNEICDKSVTEMIRDCKLHVAQNLLLNTKMTIDEIAYNSGFSTRQTFYNTFTERFNCTPKEFREGK